MLSLNFRAVARIGSLSSSRVFFTTNSSSLLRLILSRNWRRYSDFDKSGECGASGMAAFLRCTARAACFCLVLGLTARSFFEMVVIRFSLLSLIIPLAIPLQILFFRIIQSGKRYRRSSSYSRRSIPAFLCRMAGTHNPCFRWRLHIESRSPGARPS